MTVRSPRTNRLIGYAIGAVMMLIGWGFGFHNAAFFRGAEYVEGTVVELLPERISDSSFPDVSPVFEYEVHERKHRLSDHRLYSSAQWRIGDKWPLAYRPEDPSNARQADFGSKWSVVFWMNLLGVIWLSAVWKSAPPKGIPEDNFVPRAED